MNRQNLIQQISSRIPPELASDLVDRYLVIRQDLATRTLERATPGKFVETFVQILQFLDKGVYDEQPKVDDYLRAVEGQVSLDEGLRICASRVARFIYTLRNKRNIAHKNGIDPSGYDLALLHSAAQWILAELLRITSGSSMEVAGGLIESVMAPVNSIVEEIGGKLLVLGKHSCKDELLIFLHSRYPEFVARPEIFASLNRHNESTIRNTLNALWQRKLVDGDPKLGYRLTRDGYKEAEAILRDSAA
jgi:hypothetical protein